MVVVFLVVVLLLLLLLLLLFALFSFRETKTTFYDSHVMSRNSKCRLLKLIG